ncbi:hypothetical protein V6N13_001706 [Hibiscus sabdariffa]|uniref:WRKY domain-containing protein n=1 Tax=Hibiscus sabdariffa TaxID=183260 RepID=A0ABR2G923_9ROSI
MITTYEGKHNHDVPAAYGSGYVMNRSSSTTTANNINTLITMHIRPSAILVSLQYKLTQHRTYLGNAAANNGGFGFSRFGKPTSSYMSQPQFSDAVFAKDGSRDDSLLDGFMS